MWIKVWDVLKSPIARKVFVFVVSAVAEELVRSRSRRNPYHDDGQDYGQWQ